MPREKFKYLRAFKVKQEAFFIIFQGLSLKQIKPTFLEGESLDLNNPERY